MVLNDYLKDSMKHNGFAATARRRVVLRRNPYLICAAYLFLVICAELLTIYDAGNQTKYGIVLHAIILFALLIHSALESDKDKNLSLFLMALVLAPLIRILSLSMPFFRFTWITWFLLASIPIFIAILTCMWVQGLRPKDVGLSLPKLKHMHIEAGIIVLAIPISMIEYQILRPNPLPIGIANFITALLIFIVCPGFLEELAFRGLLQHNAIRLMGKWGGILIVSIFFGALHLGSNITPGNPITILDSLLAFSAGFIFSVVREKTGSIYGLSISHGLINTMLFLIGPYYF